MGQCEEGRDARPHGVAHHIRTAELQVIQQGADIVRHSSTMVGGRIVELG